MQRDGCPGDKWRSKLRIFMVPAGVSEMRNFEGRSGSLVEGAVRELRGGRVVELGAPPADAGEDWLIVVKEQTL
jgi:hypothetical protein